MEMLIFLIIAGPYFEVIVVKSLSAAGLTPVFGEVDSKSDKLSMKSAGSLHNIIEFLVAGHSGVFALESKRTTRMKVQLEASRTHKKKLGDLLTYLRPQSTLRIIFF